MRIWEVDDNKAIPSDLVREQDFILRLRRLYRTNLHYLVLELPLGRIAQKILDVKIDGLLDAIQQFAAASSGQCLELSNGDVFLIWEDVPSKRTLPQALTKELLGDHIAPEDKDAIRSYRLPADYALLRERANWHVEQAQAAAANLADQETALQILHSDAARGPLTAWGVNQIERLLDEINVRRYLRAQPVYQHHQGQWRPLFAEHFVSINDLKQERFPRLDIAAREHLFLEVCQALDRNLLAELTEHFEPIRGQAISLNVSVSTVLGGVFARFAHQVNQLERSRICFEIHRGELLNDFTQTLNAIELLRREHFRVAIDSVTPDMLAYMNIGRFAVDLIKVNVAGDRALALRDPVTLAALQSIPREKIVFFRCDTEPALRIGQELGIDKYQGWLIDGLVKATTQPHVAKTPA
jgi:EAL domain-containing protein (putative c-di-GMP-specific phosphodiesterase class I)